MKTLAEDTTKEPSRGFEPRSLDSESRVLTVTPRGQLLVVPNIRSGASFSNWKDEVHHRLHDQRENAASEDRTHDLRIMRPTRCQLRYRRRILTFTISSTAQH